MTDTAELIARLISWLTKRGQPNSGMLFRATDPFRNDDAVVEIWGPDAEFIAKHFHGQGASEAADALSSLVRERDAYQIALNKIDAIRNSILGFQSVGWSEHIYPLVAALGDAGFPGAGYEASRKNVGTLLEQIKAAEARATAAEADTARMREALEEAERFMAYFAGETNNEFVGSGTPATCLATIRAALVGADYSLAPAHQKPVAWRARRYGSSEWEVFGYDPRALKQFSFFEPLYARNALGGKDE